MANINIKIHKSKYLTDDFACEPHISVLIEQHLFYFSSRSLAIFLLFSVKNLTDICSF